MKTIFITIARGMLARNFLKNKFFLILREKYKIIILTPAYKDQNFVREFSHQNVTFIDLREYPWKFMESILVKFHKVFAFTGSIALFMRYGIPNMVPKSKYAFIKYIFAFVIFKPLSKIDILKDLLRFIDLHFFQKEMVANFRKMIKKERPSFILCLNILSDTEVALIKAAKKEKVIVWAMPKSWDNLGNYGLRIKPDKLLVWNEFMKEQAMNYHGFHSDEIEIVGLIQVDRYLQKDKILSREEFCATIGLNPNKKIILFASEGKNIPADPEIAQIIYDFIKDKRVLPPAELLIRPHFAYKDDEKRFTHFMNKEYVAVDTRVKPSPNFKDRWDFSDSFTQRFINTLYHCDVVVNTASTLSIDASIFDKPIISIMFDGYKNLPLEQSVRLWYKTDHVQALIKTGGLTIVHSREELLYTLNLYLKNPNIDSGSRQNLKKRFCPLLGQDIGVKLAEMIINAAG